MQCPNHNYLKHIDLNLSPSHVSVKAKGSCNCFHTCKKSRTSPCDLAEDICDWCQGDNRTMGTSTVLHLNEGLLWVILITPFLATNVGSLWACWETLYAKHHPPLDSITLGLIFFKNLLGRLLLTPLIIIVSRVRCNMKEDATMTVLMTLVVIASSGSYSNTGIEATVAEKQKQRWQQGGSLKPTGPPQGWQWWRGQWWIEAAGEFQGKPRA